MRFVIKAAACLVALNAIFLLLMLAVQSLDVSRIQARLREDVASGVLGPMNTAPGPFGHQLDLFTECIALSAAALPPGSGTLLSRTLEHRYMIPAQGDKGDRCGVLTGYLQDGRPIQAEPYTRYWHGYDVYIRPLVRLGLPQSRIHFLNLVLVAILCAGLVRRSAPLLPVQVMLGLLAILFLSTDLLSVPIVTTHAVGFMVCLATAWAAVEHLRSRPGDTAGLRWIALCSGAVFAFVDFLVNPPLTPTLLVFLVIAATRWQRPDVPGRAVLLSSASIAFTWFMAYATSWAAKWVVSAAVFGPRTVMDEVLAQVAKRTVGDPYEGTHRAIPVHLGSATLANVEALGWTMSLLCLACAAAVVATTWVRHRSSARWVSDGLLVASPALLPILWIEVLRNHSIVHAWFVFRSLGMSLAVVVAASTFLLLAARRSHAMPATPRTEPPGRGLLDGSVDWRPVGER